MKVVVFVLCSLLCCIATAFAQTTPATYQLPSIAQLTGHDCQHVTIAFQVTGTDPDTGYTTGLVYGQTDCASGRGGGDNYVAGCYRVEWSGDVLMEKSSAWSPVQRWSRVSIPETACWNS